MRTSYSALHTFQRCPLRYKAQYIDKITFPQSVEAFLGVTIHSALEYMMRPGQPIPTCSAVKNHFISLWEKNDLFIHQSENHIEDGLLMIEEFYNSHKHKKEGVVATEARFLLSIGGHEVVGYIDRIDKLPDTESYTIVDYKSGRTAIDDQNLHRNVQLGIYALAFISQSPLLPPKHVFTTIHALRNQMEYICEPTSEDLQHVQNEVIETIEAIELSTKANDFPSCKKSTCELCSKHSSKRL